jgi:hypothetical protein
MKTPDPDALRLAALWLRSNDGDEANTLADVAAWLTEQADAANVRTLAREAGVPVKLVRKHLRRREQTAEEPFCPSDGIG